MAADQLEGAAVGRIVEAHRLARHEGDIAEAVERLKLRAVSTFEHMTDRELDEGFARLDAALGRLKAIGWIA